MSARYEERENVAQGPWSRTAPPVRPASLHPRHVTTTVPQDVRTIKGWGVDLDPRKRPMIPRELPSDVTTARGEVRHWQIPRAQDEVYVSIEHPNRTPVFGTACPPKGLSGMLRKYAYRYGEGTNRHWMTLLIADRIDVLESLIGGVVRGKPDRYIHEKGWAAKAKHGQGREMLLIGAAVLGAVTIGVLVGTRRR